MRLILTFIFCLIFVFFSYNNNQIVKFLRETTKDNSMIATRISNDVVIKNKGVFTKFFNDYKKVAIYYHIECGIPVSIQFAQALAESGCGRSELAKRANNLFGMKYYSTIYSGGYIETSDGTKWRKYDTFEDSFIDHAEFLYRFYPNFVGKDWKYWVNNCRGYGSEGYWKHIGKIIEMYKLYEYDNAVNESV
jgi:flagellum-specific peptidoglycan hydrolase FlgJ